MQALLYLVDRLYSIMSVLGAEDGCEISHEALWNASIMAKRKRLQPSETPYGNAHNIDQYLISNIFCCNPSCTPLYEAQRACVVPHA